MFIATKTPRQKELLQSLSIEEIVSLVEELDETIEDLLHFKQTSVGLRCIDQNPKDVEYSRIVDNSFQLER